MLGAGMMGPRRDWKDARAKVDAEGVCRVCGTGVGLQAAHTALRGHDKPKKPGGKTLWVNPRGICPLCPDDHAAFDAHRLDLLGYLTADEQVYVVEAMFGIENARIRLAPSAYRKVGA